MPQPASTAITQFFAAWGEANDQARAQSLGAALTDTCRYSDPRSGGVLTGPGAIATYLAGFTAAMPGASVEIRATQGQDGFEMITAAFTANGTEMMRGTYFIAMDGDKIALIVGFAGGTP
jgi:hypothetical protein